MVSGSGTAYSLEWSVAQALPIPWNGQWLKANEVQRGGGDCALAHWIPLYANTPSPLYPRIPDPVRIPNMPYLRRSAGLPIGLYGDIYTNIYGDYPVR